MQLAARQNVWSPGAVYGNLTVISVETTDVYRQVVIVSGTLAPGRASVTVDWGDGSRQVLTANFYNLAHDYPRAGGWKIRISDDLSSFGLTRGGQDVERYKRRFVELNSVGLRVTSLPTEGFQHLALRGRLEFPSVTYIGGYCFGSTSLATEFCFPSLLRVEPNSFYCGPSPTRFVVDNAVEIPSYFADYYATPLDDMFIRSKSRAQIRAMSGFPFGQRAETRFHGSDGIVLGNGSFV